MNPAAVLARQGNRRAYQAAKQAARRQGTKCPCTTTPDLFGRYSKCIACIEREQAEMRAQVARCEKARRSATRIEQQLARLAAARKRARMTLTPEDCWSWSASLTGADL